MLGIIALAASFAAQPASAQPQAETNPEITVQGMRNPEKQISEFVGALTDAPFHGQLSRFDWEVCPAAAGLSEAQNAAIVDRMRKIADAAGIRQAKPGCRPNALVLLTHDKRELIEGLQKQHPAYFTGLSHHFARRLARSPGPAAAWQVEGRKDRDGTELKRQGPHGPYRLETIVAPSRVNPSTRPHFAASVLVVEIGALEGISVTQLADYAAMRTFARTDPERLEGSAAPTILTLLDAPMGSMIPVTLTEWDLGFLKALYSSNPDRFASQQRGEMKRQMTAELLSEGDEE